jgi:hypothetical protein
MVKFGGFTGQKILHISDSFEIRFDKNPVLVDLVWDCFSVVHRVFVMQIPSGKLTVGP